MRTLSLSIVLCCCVCWTAMGHAQFQDAKPESGQLGETGTNRWQLGLIVTASGGPCRGIFGTAAMPVDWPEQKVTVMAEDISPTARMSYENVDGAKLLVVQVPMLAAGEEAKALITLEIRRNAQLPPQETSGFLAVEERKLDRAIRPYLGASPGIESRSPKIGKIADELLGKGKDRQVGWTHVEAILQWVREKIARTEGKNKGAVAAIAAGKGNHEDMTSAFIAICRAGGIPARTVWVPKYCYAESYLQDAEGTGHWFPVDVAGNSGLGVMNDTRPILYKGDNYHPPHNRRDLQRFPAEYLTGSGGTPKKKFVRQLVD